MLITTQESQIPVDNAFDHGNEQWWRIARLAFATPFFLVTYALEEMYATYILFDIKALRAAVADPDLRIANVVLIYLRSGSGEARIWNSGQLQSVLVGTEPGAIEGQRAYVYVLRDGTRLLRADLVDDEAELHSLEEWFSI